ncbi:SapC family protein [Ruegeria faecimaris]|uniref:SapC family protein n=1 Tax=Ruegeria faecimaris TaxID=686389 RepID=UPI00232B13C2|nr:SapC family protein [Ruegeria faecimaris]
MAQNGLVPINFNRHSHRYWKRFTSYDFAAERTESVIVEEEVLQIAATFPIVFRRTGPEIEPIAVYSLLAGEPSPFVSTEGRWLASYIPSELRSHPFSCRRMDNGSTFQLVVDEGSGLLTEECSDNPFFSTPDTLGTELKEVQNFLKARATSQIRTTEICKMIDAFGLFEPLSGNLEFGSAHNWLQINSARLEQLSAKRKLELVETKGLRLIYGHQASLSNLRWLFQAQKQISQAGASVKYTENSELTGFMNAFAQAQTDDVIWS